MKKMKCPDKPEKVNNKKAEVALYMKKMYDFIM